MKETGNDTGKYINLIRNRTAKFSRNHGRRPRILITRLDPKGSDREAKLRATALADMGFDVDINTSVQSPVEISRLALENDVHAIGIPGIADHNCERISHLVNAFDDQDGKNTVIVIWTHFSPDEASRLMIKSEKLLIFKIDTATVDYATRILDVLERLS